MRHRKEDHRCKKISDCPYKGKNILEKRRLSNVNQIDDKYDPGSDDDHDSDTTENSEESDEELGILHTKEENKRLKEEVKHLTKTNNRLTKDNNHLKEWKQRLREIDQIYDCNSQSDSDTN